MDIAILHCTVMENSTYHMQLNSPIALLHQSDVSLGNTRLSQPKYVCGYKGHHQGVIHPHHFHGYSYTAIPTQPSQANMRIHVATPRKLPDCATTRNYAECLRSYAE